MPPTLIFVPGGLHDYGAIASGTGVLAPVIRGEASALTSVMGLCNSILGAGLLSLPWAFAQAGWAVGLALLAASGAASAFGLHLLTACARGARRPSFYALSQRAFPRLSAAVDFAVVLNCFGLMCSCLVIVADNLPMALVHLVARWVDGDDDARVVPAIARHLLHPPPGAVTGARALWVSVALALGAPLCFAESLHQLRACSRLSVGLAAYVAGLLVLFGVFAS